MGLLMIVASCVCVCVSVCVCVCVCVCMCADLCFLAHVYLLACLACKNKRGIYTSLPCVALVYVLLHVVLL